jgi:pyruvate formate lyase activating enzyme
MSGVGLQSKPPRSELDVIPLAGIVPLTTVDFPGRLALAVFTQGCPWRCGYCHNAGLRPLRQPTAWRWKHIRRLLHERQGFLEAVVFSGGEPTLHPGLSIALCQTREMGFQVGLHTAGMFPDRLRRLLPLLDWVGLDIKAPFDERYAQLTGDPKSASNVRCSLEILRASGIAFQLRTTVTADVRAGHDFADLCSQLRLLGAPEPVRQDSMRESCTAKLSGVGTSRPHNVQVEGTRRPHP